MESRYLVVLVEDFEERELRGFLIEIPDTGIVNPNLSLLEIVTDHELARSESCGSKFS